jgi:5'-3' exoribonuclease 1
VFVAAFFLQFADTDHLQIPNFDNLYLDMNGIVHNCSHPEGADPSKVLDEEQMFGDIMRYIEMLFNIVKPRRVFYMAIDGQLSIVLVPPRTLDNADVWYAGCAPRAKMNQQRARRFRSAQEAAENAAKLAKKTGKQAFIAFDSNCITPGTPFMARLQVGSVAVR